MSRLQRRAWWCLFSFFVALGVSRGAKAQDTLSLAELKHLPIWEEYVTRRIAGLQTGILPPQFRFLYTPGQPFLYQLGVGLDAYWQPHPLMTAEWGTSFHFNVSPLDRLQNGDRYWGDWSFYTGVRSFVLKQGIAIPYFTGRAGMASAWNTPEPGGIRVDWMLEHQVGFGVELRSQKRSGIPTIQLEASFLGQVPLYTDPGNPFTSQPRFGFQVAVKIPILNVFQIASHIIPRG